MDVKLESLIEKIKKDGIAEAKKAAAAIIKEAKDKASQIIEEAGKEAAQTKNQAESRAKKLKSNTEDSLKQAARDLSLSLKEEIKRLLEKILKHKIAEGLSADFVKELILKIAGKWSTQAEPLEILVSKEDQQKVEGLVLSELRSQARKKIEVKVSKNIEKGFRIGLKGESLYYDFTDESILESLKEFLNPAVNAILDLNNG